MRILPKPTEFSWDKGNIDKNLKKHHVTIIEAEEMFMGEPFITADPAHSTKAEKRFQALGQSKSNRRLFAVFTIRTNKIRVVSVRDMSKKEEQAYEKLKKDS